MGKKPRHRMTNWATLAQKYLLCLSRRNVPVDFLWVRLALLRCKQINFRQKSHFFKNLNFVAGMTRRFVSAKRHIRYFSNSSKLVENRAHSPVREIKMLAGWPSIAEGRDFNERSHYGSLFFCSVTFGVKDLLFLLWGLRLYRICPL